MREFILGNENAQPSAVSPFGSALGRELGLNGASGSKTGPKEGTSFNNPVRKTKTRLSEN